MAATFGHLPYDVLAYIFQKLDRTTLRAACLSSSHLNELATPLLYRDVSINLCTNNNKERVGYFSYSSTDFLMSSRPATVRGVQTTAVPSPISSQCNISSFVASVDRRRHSPTLLWLPATIP